MLKFNLDYWFMEYDAAVGKSMIQDMMLKVMTQAAREFFLAALPLVQFDRGSVRPYSTGMSLASFTNLAKFLDEPIESYATRNPELGGYHPPDTGITLDKSPANGEQMSTQEGDILKLIGGNAVFEYHTEVWQFVLWDTVGLPRGTRGPTGTPWKAFEAGRAAALKYLREFARNMPPGQQFMATTDVSIEVAEGITRAKYRRRRSILPLDPLFGVKRN